MHAGAGQHCADRNLPVTHIQMKLVTTPVLLISLTVFLRPHIALTGQVFQHDLQLLMALPLYAGPALRRFGPLLPALLPLHAGGGDRLLSVPAFPFLRLPLLLLFKPRFLLSLFGSFRISFPHGDRCGVASDMPDQTFLLCCFDHCGM